MCGICGIINFDAQRNINVEELIVMRDSMIHRGPDGAGYYINKNIGLGHRRLAILDLSPTGIQPMGNKEGSIWITYNGEFYNYREYINDLNKLGYEFRSTSDTEVILYLYEEYGLEETIRRINGMFSFCIIDLRNNINYLVRDRFGIKPLYYTVDANRIAFASEIKAFLKLKNYKLKMRRELISEYFLYARLLDYETLLQDTYEVKPGSYIKIKDGKIDENKYYDLQSKIYYQNNISESEALEEFNRRFTQSVKYQLVSDVPVGVFLSGGLDSSLIAVKMNELQNNSINTVSIGYKDKESNEFYWSDRVAKLIQSNHYKMIDNQDEYFNLLPWLSYINDGPLLTGVSFYKAAKKAKENIKVMLCGQGSDEIFAGYSLYKYAPLQNNINKNIFKYLPNMLTSLLYNILPKLSKEKIFRKVAARINMNEMELAAAYASSIPEEDFINCLKNVDHTKYRLLLNKYQSIYPKNLNADFITKLMIAEMNNGLQSIIQTTDRMTMAASVETRVPFLDHNLVEYVFSLPTKFKVKSGQQKYLLKKMLIKYFDNKFVYRPKKGFPVPITKWLFSENDYFKLKETERGYEEIEECFNLKYLRKYRDYILKGKIRASIDAVNPINRYFSLNLWWRQFKEK